MTCINPIRPVTPRPVIDPIRLRFDRSDPFRGSLVIQFIYLYSPARNATTLLFIIINIPFSDISFQPWPPLPPPPLQSPSPASLVATSPPVPHSPTSPVPSITLELPPLPHARAPAELSAPVPYRVRLRATAPPPLLRPPSTLLPGAESRTDSSFNPFYLILFSLSFLSFRANFVNFYFLPCD